jgi:tagatose-6-phosphate ketose/aldose isomerase
LVSRSKDLLPVIEGISSLCLTGSGSSEYAGDCARLALRKRLGVEVQAVAAGAILTQGADALPAGKPVLLVSLARSGDSPESVGALNLIRRLRPDIRHLVVTCNQQGSLAIASHGDSSVALIVLDDETNDRSLVMTSSFTNMLLAVRFLGLLDDTATYRAKCQEISATSSALLREQMDVLAQIARRPFRSVLFLGSGSHFAAAREASLKMLEMTAGRVFTSCESYLGLRHGPMSGIRSDTLVVGFLSTDEKVRAYEIDVLKDLAYKRLGLARVIAGVAIPPGFLGPADTAIPYLSTALLEDEDLPVLDVVVGQTLALFRCLHEGLRPDSPSEDGVIQRVVQSFTLYSPSR